MGIEAPHPQADDEYWMRRALTLAAAARALGEVPVGALVVVHGEAIAQGWNQPISTRDPTAHAEIVALRQAALAQKNYRLSEATLYVTLEPCPMCAGAIVQARVARVVFGAKDPLVGAAGSAFELLSSAKLNHRPQVQGEILADASATLLREFFRDKRQKG